MMGKTKSDFFFCEIEIVEKPKEKLFACEKRKFHLDFNSFILNSQPNEA